MQQRVTAIVVVRSGADYLRRTLASLASQTRQPDSIIVVEVGAHPRTREILATFALMAASRGTLAASVVNAPDDTSFGEAVRLAEGGITNASTENEWLWMLGHDNAPSSRALKSLLAAVEVAPSVAVAGPKLMVLERPDVIADYGETITRGGASVPLVESELDQAQHDAETDVLGVAAQGMLVRREVFTQLGGLDPGLPTVDNGLDFSIRARLAGHRVVRVPAARVESATSAAHFGRSSVSRLRQERHARAAQLHRRLAYAPLALVPLHWLSLIPLALLRSIVLVAAKRPGRIPGEFAAAVLAAVSLPTLFRARRMLRRNRVLGWAAIAPLRLTSREARHRRALAGERRTNDAGFERDRPPREMADFFASGGVWAVLTTLVLSIVASARLLGAESLTGGALIPLASTPADLWSNVGYGWRNIGAGFIGAADPFAFVLAILGSVTFWNPSLSLVVLTFAAMPLAALGAWALTRAVVSRTWLPAVAALLWGLSPTLLQSIATGHIGATITHVVLPLAILAVIRAPKSWAASGAAALLIAVIAASSPMLIPAIAAGNILIIVFRPRGAHRTLPILIPTAALFTPLAIAQMERGTPLALFADPGVPVVGPSASAFQIALGSPAGGSDGWARFLDLLASSGGAAPYIVGLLLVPMGVLAIVTVVLPRAGRGALALIIAMLGLLSALLASRIELASSGYLHVGIWVGPGVSLLWLGLIGAAVVSLDALPRAWSPGSSVLFAVATALVAVPLLAPTLLGSAGLGTAIVVQSGERTLPAYVDAEATNDPGVGTLVIEPIDAGSLAATLQRGRGSTLDDQSTLSATAPTLTDDEVTLATLAANLISRSSYDSAATIDTAHVSFVVVQDAERNNPGQQAIATRAREALDSNPLFSPVGDTATGMLWRYVGNTDGASASSSSGDHPSPVQTTWGLIVIIGLGLIFLITLLVAIPTGASRYRRSAMRPAQVELEGSDE